MLKKKSGLEPAGGIHIKPNIFNFNSILQNFTKSGSRLVLFGNLQHGGGASKDNEFSRK